MAISHKPIPEQVIVLTGASSGIGLATAQAAARQGARLVLAARSQQTLHEISGRLQAEGGSEVVYVVADVGSSTDVHRIAHAAIERFGRIDTWINNAGVSIFGRLDQVSEDDNRRLFDTNFWGVVNGSLIALPHLRASGGALINVGSEVSDAVVPLQGMYVASKHAVKGFTDALRMEVEELDKAPVTITLIQPTAVDTPYPQHARNYMDQQAKLPMEGIAPEKVAEAILEAAVKGGRDVTVGVVAKLNTTLAKVMPAAADKLAHTLATRQREDEPPHHPEGTLYQPGNDGRVHGSDGVARH
jgi:short-subunit dehydrogenase